MEEVDHFHTYKQKSELGAAGAQARDSLHVELQCMRRRDCSKGKPVPALGRAEFDLHACHRAVASN